MSEQTWWISTLLLVAAVLTALGVVWRQLVKPTIRFLNQAHEFFADWHGEPARPGRDARPGVPQRLAQVEAQVGTVMAEVKPNGGHSLRDAVNRTEAEVTLARKKLEAADDDTRRLVDRAVAESVADRKALKLWVKEHAAEHERLHVCTCESCHCDDGSAPDP